MLDLAILEFFHRDQRTVYWAEAARNAPPFLTAPAVLIQGIYEKNPEFARKILRGRIYASGPMTDALHGLVKVCAKRIDTDVSLEQLQTRIAEDGVEVFTVPISTPTACPPSASPMDRARRLAHNVERGEKPLYQRDRAIGAVLLSKENELIAHAVNTNAVNRFCHAEINLLRELHSRGFGGIPAGASLYVTLKPCRMCAAMILEFCEDRRSIRVFYDEDDPGPNARRTALDLSPDPIQTLFTSRV
jgi:tRNA(Arg) A34 adenosine deaminase TadA